MNAVETRALRHRYGDRTALDGLDVEWPENRIIGVLGPNGSGKSTLFRILSTALVPSEGDVRVLGRDVRTEPALIRQALGTVFQSPALDPELTVAENLDVFAALHGVSSREFNERLPSLLDELDVRDRLRDRTDRLSGGLRRRVDLARSLVHEPRLLLLDEPTSGLDPSARQAFWTALQRIRSSRPLTLIVSTHSFEEAAACDLLVVLDAGRVAISGEPEALVRDLGPESLWIEAEDPNCIEDALGPADRSEPAGNRIRISGPALTDTLVRIRERCPRGVRAMELRPPGLADVYEAATGHRWTGTASGEGRP